MKAYGVFFDDCLCHTEPDFRYAIYLHKKDAEDHAYVFSDAGIVKYSVKEVNIEEKEVI